MAGLGTSFLFVYVGLVAWLLPRRGQSEDGAGRGSLEGSQLDSDRTWSPVWAGLPGAEGKSIVGETASSFPCLVYSFPSPVFSSSFLLLSQARWCSLGPKNLWSKSFKGWGTSWKNILDFHRPVTWVR